MFERREVPAPLVRLAACQGGLLSHQQALPVLGRAPLRRLLATGEWHPVSSRIYAVKPGQVTDEQRLWAGHLAGGDGSALGGRAALFLGGVVAAVGEIDVWLPPGRRRRLVRPGYAFREDHWNRLAHTMGRLPRIRLEEALIDVGASCDVEGWVTVLAEAARLGKVRLPDVVRRMDARSRVPQREMLRDVATDLQGVESTLEWVYRRDVERAHGLPEGERQVRIVDGWRCDVRYAAHRTIVELDGQHHGRRVLRDLTRDNDHALRDETTLRYGTVDVRARPCQVSWQVGGLLHRRGGALPTPCPHCPAPVTCRAWAGLA